MDEEIETILTTMAYTQRLLIEVLNEALGALVEQVAEDIPDAQTGIVLVKKLMSDMEELSNQTFVLLGKEDEVADIELGKRANELISKDVSTYTDADYEQLLSVLEMIDKRLGAATEADEATAMMLKNVLTALKLQYEEMQKGGA